MSTIPLGGAADAKRLVENLLGDLRNLSTEARKKQVQVKEAAESGLVKVRNISTGSNEQNLLTNLRLASSELLQPLLMGCASKNARLVQISLLAIQKMVQHRVVEPSSAPIIVNELWHLMEAECEELRVLQTLTPLVSTELLVTGPWLAKCLVICFRLNFAKDPIVINTASATVRQMVSCVFERVVQEDGLKSGDLPIVHQTVKVNTRAAPPTLRPCAADGYMLFRDLCLLINAEAPCWLLGIQEMTRTLGLELLESVLAGYPSVFIKHTEFAQLLKDQVCPLVIRLFAPNHKHIQLPSQHPHSVSSRNSVESATVGQMPGSPERPYFPISMRLLRVVVVLVTHFYQILVTECEIFLSLLIKFLESDKLGWQRAITLEVLHRILVQSDLLIWFCENYDARPNSTKVVQSVMSGLAAYVQLSFLRPDFAFNASKEDEQFEGSNQAMGQSGFLYRGIWIPLCQNITPKKSILLDSLDKHDAIVLPEGYALSLTYSCITDCCQSIFQAFDTVSQKNCSAEVSMELFQSTYSSLLAAMSLLLDASIDESVTEHLLKCFSTIAVLSCRLGHAAGRDATFAVLCKAALPPDYLVRVLSATPGLGSLPVTLSSLQDKDVTRTSKSGSETFDSDMTSGQPSQVVAVGTVCPTPSLNSAVIGTSVMLTAKNIQVARVLIACAQMNGQELADCWLLILATVQHLVWILGMKPNAMGGFPTDGDAIDSASSSVSAAVPNTTVLTTAVMADVSVMASMLNKLFDSTVNLDDVGLHHVIAALCKLSSEAMLVSQNGLREPSYFPVAKLQQTGLANLTRLEVFWKPITAHLIEVSGHSYFKLREWGALALTTLVKNALKIKVESNETKRQQLILAPLSAMCEVEFVDVRRKQMDCLMNVLQSAGQQLTPEQWPTVIDIVANIVDQRFNFDESLIKQSYEAVALMVTDFLEVLPFSCVQMLVETDAKYGAQQCELNISLSALGQLWTISDFVYRKSPKLSEEESETIWLVLYNCLSELCVDGRPPVRKSACQTLLQTIAAHGLALKNTTWKHMVWKILFPMLDKVRSLTRGASKIRTDSAALGASNILIHHSRDTESKQWAETSVQTLCGVVKIFNAQRSLLVALDDFYAAWSTLLQYIEYLATSDNNEMSLAALKSFQEVLLGRVSAQTLDINTRERSTSTPGSMQFTEDPPALPEALWLVSWEAWMRIARALITPRSEALSISVTSQNPRAEDKVDSPMKQFIPGPSHLTTVLHIFSPLFDRVKKKISVEELKYNAVPSIFKGIIGVPISTEQAPFIMATSSDITPTQEAILDSIRVIYQEMIDSNSSLRPALPDLIRLMLDFTILSIRAPATEFITSRKDNSQCWVQNMVPFAEISLRTMVEFYANTAHYPEIVQSAVLVDIVQCLTQPMELKYQCPSQSTWKAAASAFITVLRLGLPIARQQVRLFMELWPSLVDGLDRFLFTHSRSPIPLNADERKRHEFIDCQLIELVRTEILPYMNLLPSDFARRIIELLNRGSISTMDASDVLASESYLQRADLSRACFDALLSMSQNEEPDIVRSTAGGVGLTSDFTNAIHGVGSTGDGAARSVKSSHLGTSAIASLLIRCRQVMWSFVRDEQSAGQLRLPQERVIEMVCVMRAIGTLIDGLVRRPNAIHSDFYSELVNLYPLLVDCVPSSRADSQVEQALIATLKGYQTLLLLKVHR